MKLNELILETQLLELCQILFEKDNNADVGNNRTVAAWSKKLGMTYDQLHKVWEKAAEGKGTNYFAIMGAFKKAVTSLKGVTKTALMKDGNAKFNYKVRTQQTVDQLLDDKPAPKNTNKDYVKRTKVRISDINKKMKEIQSKPNNTALRKDKIKKELMELRAKKKELQDSLK